MKILSFSFCLSLQGKIIEKEKGFPFVSFPLVGEGLDDGESTINFYFDLCYD